MPGNSEIAAYQDERLESSGLRAEPGRGEIGLGEACGGGTNKGASDRTRTVVRASATYGAGTRTPDEAAAEPPRPSPKMHPDLASEASLRGMRKFAVALLSALVVPLTGCDELSGLSLPWQSGDPKTLEAATAAAQEWSDRRQAGDYAGVWLMYSEQIRDGISQDDYVALSETCQSSIQKMPVTVSGVRMEGPDRAIVRLKALGFPVQIDMAYEDGKWVMPPDADFAAELGKPVSQIIAGRKAERRCDDADLSSRLEPQSPTAITTTTKTPTPTTTTTTATTAATPTLPAANAQTIDELLAVSPFARERPIVSGLKDQGFGYLDYELVSMAWDRTCSTFGGAQGASEIAVNDAKNELLEMRFTPAEADAIIGIALEVHGSTGIEGCG